MLFWVGPTTIMLFSDKADILTYYYPQTALHWLPLGHSLAPEAFAMQISCANVEAVDGCMLQMYESGE